LHDTGRSGWWALIGLVPLAGLIVLIIFCAAEGDQGSNAYGEPPSTTSSPGGSEGPAAVSMPRTKATDLSRIEQLYALYEKGALTEDEFKAQKAKLLG
jgi:uncharacterized membrane protein